MQGTFQEEKCGYKWMRIGHADARFANVIIFVSLSAIVFLALWIYWEIPKTEWYLVNFVAIYVVAAILYLNLGVWIHEQLHCLSFRRTSPEKRTKITFSRKCILFLNGHYRVKGAIRYRIMKRALLAPMNLSISLLIIVWLGNLILSSWWLPILLYAILACFAGLS